MFHLSAYTLTTAGALAFQDMSAAVDGSISQRNNHLIFTEPYRLLAAMIMGATITDARLDNPTLNAVSLHHITPPLASATVPTNPTIDDYRAYPIQLPINEEIGIRMSNGAAETDQAFIFLGTPNWNVQLPNGIRRLTMRATATATRVANAWSGSAALTFEQSPRGGVYAIIGAECIEASTLAFRIDFPRARLNNGRKMFPGDIAKNAAGNVPNKYGRSWLGEWGRFHTFEPPFLQVFSTAAGAGAETLNLDCILLGDDPSLLSAA